MNERKGFPHGSTDSQDRSAPNQDSSGLSCLNGVPRIDPQTTDVQPTLRGEKNESRSSQYDLSFQLLGLVYRGQDEPVAFCCVTWSGSASSPSRLQMFVGCNWMRQLKGKGRAYIADLLCDWKGILLVTPAALLAQIRQLSVGPIRTMHEGRMDAESAIRFIHHVLGHPHQFPKSTQ